MPPKGDGYLMVAPQAVRGTCQSPCNEAQESQDDHRLSNQTDQGECKQHKQCAPQDDGDEKGPCARHGVKTTPVSHGVEAREGACLGSSESAPPPDPLSGRPVETGPRPTPQPRSQRC